MAYRRHPDSVCVRFKHAKLPAHREIARRALAHLLGRSVAGELLDWFCRSRQFRDYLTPAQAHAMRNLLLEMYFAFVGQQHLDSAAAVAVGRRLMWRLAQLDRLYRTVGGQLRWAGRLADRALTGGRLWAWRQRRHPGHDLADHPAPDPMPKRLH